MALHMTKEDFLCRLNDRISGRYGDPVTQPWLKDLVKDGLVEPLGRGQNRGKRPTYFATACHYRRALQIKRLHFQGVQLRDAILLQLFIYRYGVSGKLAREVLRKEFTRAFDILNRQLKSSHFDREISDTPGPKRMKVVSRQMGQLDRRFVERGLELPKLLYLQIVKFARSATNENENPIAGALLEADGHFSPAVERALNISPNELEALRDIVLAINQAHLRPTFGSAFLATPGVAAILLVLIQMASTGGFTSQHLAAIIELAPGFENLLNDWSSPANRQI